MIFLWKILQSKIQIQPQAKLRIRALVSIGMDFRLLSLSVKFVKNFI